ncbi:MAG: hypothetical protein IKX62_00810 [Bacteroidales bacterium]|nr:hypothetical protein [Bacteroidales bacterium]
MRKSIISLLDEAQKKMGGYVSLLNYRYMNLCIKALPEALLAIMVKTEDGDEPIENVAKARNPKDRDDQFEILPLSPDLLIPLVKGIKIAHPEFDLDIRDANPDSVDKDRVQYIVATMPVVNKDRHDVLMQAVAMLSDACNGILDATMADYAARIVVKLIDAPGEEVDEAKDSLQQIRDRYDEMSKTFRADKEKEIEEAYARYQEEQAEKEAKKQEEEDSAQEAQAGLKMKWNPDDDE